MVIRSPESPQFRLGLNGVFLARGLGNLAPAGLRGPRALSGGLPTALYILDRKIGICQNKSWIKVTTVGDWEKVKYQVVE